MFWLKAARQRAGILVGRASGLDHSWIDKDPKKDHCKVKKRRAPRGRDHIVTVNEAGRGPGVEND